MEYDYLVFVIFSSSAVPSQHTLLFSSSYLYPMSPIFEETQPLVMRDPSKGPS